MPLAVTGDGTLQLRPRHGRRGRCAAGNCVGASSNVVIKNDLLRCGDLWEYQFRGHRSESRWKVAVAFLQGLLRLGLAVGFAGSMLGKTFRIYILICAELLSIRLLQE